VEPIEEDGKKLCFSAAMRRRFDHAGHIRAPLTFVWLAAVHHRGDDS
jgi:hypothetical protein